MTTREDQVYRLIGQGHSLSSIAGHLDVAVATVREDVLSLHQALRESGTATRTSDVATDH
jgi:DNA-binding CsgD family transcriptional regulator